MIQTFPPGVKPSSPVLPEHVTQPFTLYANFTTTGWASVYGNLILPKTTGYGIKVDNASPTFPWHDLLGDIKTRTGGASAPTFAVYQGSIYQFSYGVIAGVREVFNEFHPPHDMLTGSTITQYIHAHWSTIAAPTGDINWLFDVSYAKGYGQDVFEGTTGTAAPITVSVVQTAATAFQHEIAEVQFVAPLGLIQPAAVNVSITAGTPTLTAASALFTAADVGRTVTVLLAGPLLGALQTTISAFTSTTQVTLADNATNTVTNQPVFYYRVLDSARMEIDGLILVRTWRDAGRAADTLDVAPFLHEVDVHYQSTGIGTKDKNAPFYT